MESEENITAQENGEEAMEVTGDSGEATEAAGQTNEEDGGDEEQDETAGDDVSPKLGLLDMPLVQEGRRKTHSVQRLQVMSPDREKKKVDILPGKGTPLGEIEAIEQGWARVKSDELKLIHRLAFGRPGTSFEVKRNLRQFSGFTFGKSDDQFERKHASLAKYPIEVVRETCDQLCLSRSGKKDDLTLRVMEFLLKPTKEAATGGRKATSAKRKRSLSSSKKKTPTKVKKSKAAADSDNDDEDESPKKKKRMPKKVEKTPTKSPAKSSTKSHTKSSTKLPSGSAKRKQSAPKKSTRVATVANDSESDDEPLSRKFRTFPSDDDLVEAIKSVLNDSDLESVTVKSVLLEVYATYPDQDLSSKKDFLKSNIKEIYASMA